MNKLTVRDVEVKGKRVLVRVDFNVPLDEQGRVTDDSRIVAALPTIRYLLEAGARVILASHLGRPKGKVVEGLRLDPVATRLAGLLGRPVARAGDCVGEEARRAAAALRDGEVLLLENLRFHPGEEKNDPGFARSLAELADLYVNDAFGAAHRAHASTAGIADFLPAVAGFLLEKELEALGRLLHDPERPFLAVLGGAKVSDKIGVIRNLLNIADGLVVGGGMANTFLAARGYRMAASLREEDKEDLARNLLAEAARRGKGFHLPVDLVAAAEVKPGADRRVVKAEEGVPPGWKAVDIGPASMAAFGEAIASARTVFWNGPMGVFEIDEFAAGTEAVARALAESKATTVVGGGDSVAALEKLGLAGRMTHISTGGGASLEFLEGLELPGVACLMER